MGRGKSQRSLALVDAATTILAEIQPASVRAVCYRLFTAGLTGSMAKSETNKVSKQLTWAREQGRILPGVDVLRLARLVDDPGPRDPESYRQALYERLGFLEDALRGW